MELAGLGDIAWGDTTHAYGPALDVPDQLRDLASADARRQKRALDRLYSNIHHQGTVYEATVAAVPFLWAIAGAPQVGNRERVLALLRTLTGGDDFGYDELVHAGARDDPGLPLLMRVRAAVHAGLEQHRAVLDDADAKVRCAALYLLSTFAEHASSWVPALLARLAAEPKAAARIELVLALGELVEHAAEPFPRVTSSLLPLLDHEDAALRAATAIALTWQQRSSHAEALAPRANAVLVESLGRKLPSFDKTLWADGDALQLIRGAVARDVELLRRTLASPPSDSARADLLQLIGGRMWTARHERAEWAPLLAPALLDEASPSRWQAAYYFAFSATPHGRVGAEGMTEALARALRETDLRVTTADKFETWLQRNGPLAIAHLALHGLAKLGEPRALEPLMLVMEHRPISLDMDLAMAGMSAFSDQLLPAVRSCLRSPHPWARWVLGGVRSWKHAAASLTPDLLELVPDDTSGAPFMFLAQVLGAITPQDHPDAARAARTVARGFGSRWTADLAVAHYRLTGDPDPAIHALRTDMKAGGLHLRAVAEIGPPAAALVGDLRKALSNTMYEVPILAACALWRVTGETDDALPVLVEALRLNHGAIALTARCLGEIGPRASAAIPRLRALIAPGGIPPGTSPGTQERADELWALFVEVLERIESATAR